MIHFLTQGNYMINVKKAALVIATVIALPVAAETYTVDPGHTYPSFEISHFGFSNLRGQFEKTEGTVVLDRKEKKGSANITIESKSINTGHQKRDEHLKGEEFFNVKKYPTLKFKADDFKFDGDKLVEVNGKLTLLAVTKPVTLQIKSFTCGPHPMNKKETCGIDAVTSIKRSDFGMNTFAPAIGDEVKISIGMEASVK